jgi:hypothetical protein
MSEKSEINGGPYQYDDYGTVDKTRIIDQDELVSLIDFFTHYRSILLVNGCVDLVSGDNRKSL